MTGVALPVDGGLTIKTHKAPVLSTDRINRERYWPLVLRQWALVTCICCWRFT